MPDGIADAYIESAKYENPYIVVSLFTGISRKQLQLSVPDAKALLSGQVVQGWRMLNPPKEPEQPQPQPQPQPPPPGPPGPPGPQGPPPPPGPVSEEIPPTPERPEDMPQIDIRDFMRSFGMNEPDVRLAYDAFRKGKARARR